MLFLQKLATQRLLLRMLAVTMALAFAASTGCKAPRHTDYEAFQYGPATISSVAYRMEPPDVVRVTSKRVPEIHDQIATIRSDGMITLPLLGDVKIAGRTPAEVSQSLQQLAAEFYERPDVAVQVLEFNSKQIFVFGEVSNAGPYRYDGANTVLETVAAAQPTRLADYERIQVIRPSRDGGPGQLMTFDLEYVLATGNAGRDAILEEGDIIYLPPNPLAAVGLAFQQILLPLQPAAATMNMPMRFDTSFRSMGPNSGF